VYLQISEQLAANCRKTAARKDWLSQLPRAIDALQRKWLLSLADPFTGDNVSCSWVAPGVRSDGTRVVLKLGMPHMEGEHEIAGLRFWEGEPTVRLLEADEPLNAMLLERCEPGTVLRALPEPEQDIIIAGLLRRLWRLPATPHQFRPLSMMTAHWANETAAHSDSWPDAGIVREGLGLFTELSQSSTDDVLLATDVHAGNVLRSGRDLWTVIDPKPFLGDVAYDATQHLFNCEQRLRRDPVGTIRRFAELLEVDFERVRLWMFARAAAEPRDTWDQESIALAKVLA